MKTRTLLLLTALGVIALFVALNWNAFMAPTDISLGFAGVRAPLGLIMLGMIFVLLTLFMGFALYLESTMLFDTRRAAREMQAVRELADQAEASRFSALRTELAGMAKREEEANAAMLERMEQHEREIRLALEQMENTLGAYFGSLEERLEKKSA